MEATKRPWTLEQVGVTNTGPNGEDVFDIGVGDPMQVRIGTVVGQANAHLIVTAVNHFEEMREALEQALPLLVRLGDFIGNGEKVRSDSLGERCDVILAIKKLLEKVKEG